MLNIKILVAYSIIIGLFCIPRHSVGEGSGGGRKPDHIDQRSEKFWQQTLATYKKLTSYSMEVHIYNDRTTPELERIAFRAPDQVRVTIIRMGVINKEAICNGHEIYVFRPDSPQNFKIIHFDKLISKMLSRHQVALLDTIASADHTNPPSMLTFILSGLNLLRHPTLLSLRQTSVTEVGGLPIVHLAAEINSIGHGTVQIFMAINQKDYFLQSDTSVMRYHGKSLSYSEVINKSNFHANPSLPDSLFQFPPIPSRQKASINVK